MRRFTKSILIAVSDTRHCSDMDPATNDISAFAMWMFAQKKLLNGEEMHRKKEETERK
ncbi:hypothetical protein Tco_1433182, partial [Tanacetum coccineum]